MKGGFSLYFKIILLHCKIFNAMLIFTTVLAKKVMKIVVMAVVIVFG